MSGRGRELHRHPVRRERRRRERRVGEPEPGGLRERPDQHDGDAIRDDQRRRGLPDGGRLRSGLNAPFGFDFGSCGAGGGFTGPGTCTVKERFSPTATGRRHGTTNVFECPVVGGTCIGIPFNESGTGVSPASATPNPVSFGNVPINTTRRQTVTITVDAGYRTEVASGSGLNAPFAFDFDTCGTGGGFTGPGSARSKERFTPTALGAATGRRTSSSARSSAAPASAFPFNVSGTGVSAASATPTSGQLRQRADQHDARAMT